MKKILYTLLSGLILSLSGYSENTRLEIDIFKFLKNLYANSNLYVNKLYATNSVYFTNNAINPNFYSAYSDLIQEGYINQFPARTLNIGTNNNVSGTYSSVGGGRYNIMSGQPYSFIGAGVSNLQSGSYAFIGAGQQNTNTASYSFIGSGERNKIRGAVDSIIGCGYNNAIENSSHYSFIGAGGINIITNASDRGFIGNGSANKIHSTSVGTIVSGAGNVINNGGTYAFIGSGEGNNILNTSVNGRNIILTGQQNLITGSGSYYSSILGGLQNTNNSTFAVIVNAYQAHIGESSDYGFIGNGFQNKIFGVHSFIGSGNNNKNLNGSYSFIGSGYYNLLNNSSHSFIGIGDHNTIDGGNYSVIVGGNYNSIIGPYTTIGGGSFNKINGSNNERNTISGGYTNRISSQKFSIIGGGAENIIEPGNVSYTSFNTIGGGNHNRITENNGSFIGGGGQNNIGINDGTSDQNNTIVGGINNTIERGTGHFIGGGRLNSLNTGGYGYDNVICGGYDNDIPYCDKSFIGGGYSNKIFSGGDLNNIVGGHNNKIETGSYSAILGGQNNRIGTAGDRSVILGGYNNYVASSYSLAFGVSLGISHNNCYLFGLNGGSIADNEMCLRNVNLRVAEGSVAIGGNLLVGGTKNFKIDHPLDKNKTLKHISIEGPKADLLYRGKVKLVSGTATVDIDKESNMTKGTFCALTRNPQVFLQNETGWEPLKYTITNEIIKITCKDPNSEDIIGWMVVAERNDPTLRKLEKYDENDNIIIEEEKDEEKIYE